MARGRKSSLRIVLSSEEQQTLERWQLSTTLAAGLVRRGRIILLLGAGASQSAVVQAVGVQWTVVRHWAKRFLAQRLDALSDAPGRGAKGGFSPGGRDPRRAPASGRIWWVVASPSGNVSNSRGSSSPMGSWKISLPPRCGGFWPSIT